MKKLSLFLLTLVMTGLWAVAQNATVTGTVVDADNDEPLVGVSVIPVGGGQGAQTDIDGNFTLSVPRTVKSLNVSYVGYKPMTVAITPGHMTIKMLSTTHALDEVMVVAYGTTKKSAYTGSASKIDASELDKTLVTTATQALNGKMSGVTVQSSNGAPGTAPSILIRGVGSINASTAPLYVVDGLPYNGDISAINPADIEQMTVLKDAASTALYGARGANGVIMITTKRGQEGKTRITVDANWGGNSRSLANYDVITDQPTYLTTIYNMHRNTALYNLEDYDTAAAHQYGLGKLWSSLGYRTWSTPEGQDIIGANGKFNPNATPGWRSGDHYYIGDDWIKESFINGLRQSYDFALQGGNNKFNYYLSVGYLGNEGVIKGSHYNRLSTSAKVDYQAYSWLKVGSDITYTYTNKGYPGDNNLDNSTSSGNSFYAAYNMAPVYPFYVRDAEGNIEYNKTYNLPIFDYGDGKSTPYSRNFLSIANPTGQLLYDTTDYIDDIFDGKWYAKVNPIKDLYVTGTIGYNLYNERMHYVANNLYGQSADYGGQAGQESFRQRTISTQVIGNYGFDFLDHNRIDVMLGYESQNVNIESVYAYGSNLYRPGVYVIDNTADDKNPYGYEYGFANTGYFGRVNYNYDNKYFFSGSVRRDGSSRFHKDHRWGTFFSLTAAWDIAKESFMQQFTNVDLLKFKVSFGQNGNDNMGGSFYNYFTYADFYQIIGADGVWSDGTFYVKGNKDLTWEKSNNFNIGFDFSFFKGKLAGTLEYYQREIKDMLFWLPTAPSLGYSSYPANVGNMRNNGLELELTYRPIETKDFMLQLNGNITVPSNKVTKLAPDIIDPEYNGWVRSATYLVEEGKPLYQMWLVPYAGVDPETGISQYWAREKFTYTKEDEEKDPSHKEGTVYYGEDYKTENWVEARNTNRKQTGNIMPKIYGGFGLNARVYDFDFSIAFSYQCGGKVYDNSYASFMYNGASGGQFIGQNIHKDMLAAWTPENTNTNIPRLSTVDQYPLSTSDFYMISSNYLSLNNINVGYTVPKRWTSKAGIEAVRIYFAADNVALWSKRKGLDPRQDYRTSSNSTYSPMRTISGGIRLSF